MSECTLHIPSMCVNAKCQSVHYIYRVCVSLQFTPWLLDLFTSMPSQLSGSIRPWMDRGNAETRGLRVCDPMLYPLSHWATKPLSKTEPLSHWAKLIHWATEPLSHWATEPLIPRELWLIPTSSRSVTPLTIHTYAAALWPRIHLVFGRGQYYTSSCFLLFWQYCHFESAFCLRRVLHH